MPVIFPPTDLAVQAETAEPEVHEDPPVESMLLVALKRINGRLESSKAGKQQTVSPLHAEQDMVAQLRGPLHG